MHEQARLTCPFPAIGKGAGENVSISEVEKHYTASAMANSALSFVCSDCGVPVSARIIQPYVPDRKVTPSSGFRASDQGKPHTCNREPQQTVDVSPSASGTAPLHSSQGSAPERWVDPRKGTLISGASLSIIASVKGAPTSTSRGRNGAARGQSVGQSQTVEKFAREWQKMSVVQRKSTPLFAPWNANGRGSYFSAFHPLGYDPKVTSNVYSIYEGTARHVCSEPDGYDVELNEHLIGGLPLHIWIPTVCLSFGAAGGQLAAQLLKLSQAPASPKAINIYALGDFEVWPALAPNRLRLEVEHPHMFWIE